MDEFTATRATQDQEWISLNNRVDWMVAPDMAEYVNRMVSGRGLNDDGHWALHALREHVLPIANRRAGGVSVLSLGCGDAHIEYSLIEQFGWPINRLVGLEYDKVLRNSAEHRFNGKEGVSAEFLHFDFNSPNAMTSAHTFDIVFCCHALHHASDIEVLLPFINSHLAIDGRFIGIEYLGPTRFQIEYDILPIIKTLFTILPEALRKNISRGDIVEGVFNPDTIAIVRQADISESVRSSDLRTLLLSSFPVEQVKPMGGTILRWLLRDRAGNFDHCNAEHVAIARLLQFIEQQLIESGVIRSDDLFFVLRKSERL